MDSLVDQVRERIVSRYCRTAGVRIPPERHLVEGLGVSRATLQAAMSELAAKGLIRRYRGKGTFVTHAATDTTPATGTLIVGSVWWRMRSAEIASLQEVIDFFSGRNAMPLVQVTHNDPVREVEVLEQLVKAGVAGIVLAPATQGSLEPSLPRHIERLGLNTTTPVVLHGQSRRYAGFTSVSPDHEAAGYLAAKHLIELGHRRIAHIGCRSYLHTQAEWAGFERAMREAGLECRDDLMLDITGVPHDGQNIQMGRNAARVLLSGNDQPTAVATYWSEVAAGVMLEAIARGMSVPGDLAVVGKGSLSPAAQATLPMPLSHVAIDQHAVAMRAAEALLEEIEGAAPAGRDIRLEVTLQPAESSVGPSAQSPRAL